MNAEELQTLEIPVGKLIALNNNVRRTGVEEGIGELADSIAALGLLQSRCEEESAHSPQIEGSRTSEGRQRSPVRALRGDSNTKQFHVLTESVRFCPSFR